MIPKTGQRIAEENLFAGGVRVAAFVFGETGGLLAGLGALEHHGHHVWVDRLEQIILSAVPDGCDGALHVAFCRTDDYGGVGRENALSQQIGAEAVRQIDVEQCEVEWQRPDHPPRFVDRANGGDVGVVLFEHGRYLLAQQQFVLQHQHACTFQGGLRHTPNVGELGQGGYKKILLGQAGNLVCRLAKR